MKKRPADSLEKSSPANAMGRRDFGRLVALTVAGSAFAASPRAASAHEFEGLPRLAFREQEQRQPPLSSSAQAEVEAKLRHIFDTYGSRLNDDQKRVMRRTVSDHVRMLEAIRPINEANGDAPATVLKLFHDSSAGAADRPPASPRPRRGKSAGKGR